MMKYMIPVVLSLSASAEGVQFTKDHSINCLALNIYHEARGDNYAGQVAVADVVLNRPVFARKTCMLAPSQSPPPRGVGIQPFCYQSNTRSIFLHALQHIEKGYKV